MLPIHTVYVITAATVITAITTIYLYRKKKKNVDIPTKWNAVGKVKKLHMYPLKSGRRIELKSAECTEFGIRQTKNEENALQLRDRCFVVYGSKNNELKTAETFPKMVLIEVAVHNETHISFDAPGIGSISVKIPNLAENIGTNITMHQKEEIYTLDCGDEAGQWISRYIHGQSDGLRIGYHDGSVKHRRNIEKAHKNHVTAYEFLRNQSAGLYSELTSMLLLNQASVDDLNSKIECGTFITSEHFRPTIIIDGPPAFTEDSWKWVKMGEVILRNVKPCTRCITTTINPETGIRNKNREPLKTLEKYRRIKDISNQEYEGNLTVMGIDLEVVKNGVINLEDEIFVGL